MVKIQELLVNGVSVPLSGKTLLTNGTALKKDTFVFATADPNMTVMVSQLPMQGENTLSVKLEIAPLSESLAEGMADSNKKKWIFS